MLYYYVITSAIEAMLCVVSLLKHIVYIIESIAFRYYLIYRWELLCVTFCIVLFFYLFAGKIQFCLGNIIILMLYCCM